MTNAELIAKIKAEIERRLKDYWKICFHDVKAYNEDSNVRELKELLSFLSDLEKECEDFPTTDEEMAKFLATHPKVEVPEKYKTPDWLWKKQEQPEVDLEKEIQLYIESIGFGRGGWVDGLSDKDLRDIARHFAEWGYLRAAEKYNEIEYNRQRAEESVPNDLEEAAKEYAKTSFTRPYSDNPDEEVTIIEPDKYAGFIAGARHEDEQLSEKIAAAYQLGLADKEKQMLKEAVECELYYDGDFLAIDLNMAELGYSERDKVRIIVLKNTEK